MEDFSAQQLSKTSVKENASAMRQQSGPGGRVSTRFVLCYIAELTVYSKGHDARLEKKGSELRAAMERYLRTLSQDQRRTLVAGGNDFTAIMSIMETSVFDWTHRAQHRGTVGGSVKNFFHKSCKALDEHSSMLEMLPQQSEYVSLFYGGLKTIIQVRTNVCGCARLRLIMTGVYQLPDGGLGSA